MFTIALLIAADVSSWDIQFAMNQETSFVSSSKTGRSDGQPVKTYDENCECASMGVARVEQIQYVADQRLIVSSLHTGF